MSGVSMELIKQTDIKVDEYEGKAMHIHTIICGDLNSKPKLVLIHGYGGSGALFFKIIKPLIEQFCLILVDIIGMGSSSRPDNFKHDYNDRFTPEEANDYFVEYFEKWRKAMNSL